MKQRTEDMKEAGGTGGVGMGWIPIGAVTISNMTGQQ